jgi:hypothetical protein
MPTRYTAKQLAETSERLRYERHKKGLRQEDILEFEYRKGNETRVLKRVRFGLNPASGRPTRKTIDCIEEGVERSYDGKYEFEVTAFKIAGHKIDEFLTVMKS